MLRDRAERSHTTALVRGETCTRRGAVEQSLIRPQPDRLIRPTIRPYGVLWGGACRSIAQLCHCNLPRPGDRRDIRAAVAVVSRSLRRAPRRDRAPRHQRRGVDHHRGRGRVARRALRRRARLPLDVRPARSAGAVRHLLDRRPQGRRSDVAHGQFHAARPRSRAARSLPTGAVRPGARPWGR